MLENDIKKILRGQVMSKDLDTYARDASMFEVHPQLVVVPKNASDISDLVSFITKYNQKRKVARLSLTARAAGTDMTGGPLTRSIVLDMLPHFNHILKIDARSATAEPGVFYRDFEKYTLEHGLLLPSFPASRELCTIGGMVANNSGGEKTLAYGKTDRYVQQLKVILSDSHEYIFKPLHKKELQEKLALATFEGSLYRNLYKLLTKNHDLIQNAKPKTTKNSAGYALWNVWNGTTFDLTKLFCGSQGTLGIITEATFNLIRPKQHSRLLVMFLKPHHISQLPDIIHKVLTHKPESFESYDDHTLRRAAQSFTHFSSALKHTNIIKLAWQFIPEFWMMLTNGVPKLILLAEFTGATDTETYTKAQQTQTSLTPFNLTTHITQSDTEREKYITIRRESFNLLRTTTGDERAMPFIDDITVPVYTLPAFLPQLEKILHRSKLTYSIAGHIGDANFHIIPLMDMRNTKNHSLIPKLMREVYQLTFKYGGSMTAEHNDGILRSPFLKDMYGTEIYSLFAEVKNIFDPHGIFNPGKKVGSTWKYAYEHMVTR